jgi:hypothetical protein
LYFLIAVSFNFLNPGCLPTSNDGCPTAAPVRLYSCPPHPTVRKNCNDFLFCLTWIELCLSNSQPLSEGSSSVSSSCFVRLLLHSFIQSTIYLFIQSINHLFIYLFIYLFNQPFIYSFIHSINHLFIYSFIHSFNQSFIYSFIHSFNQSFIYSFIHSFNQPFIYLFVNSFIKSINHLFIYSFIHSLNHPVFCSPLECCTVSTGKCYQHSERLKRFRLQGKEVLIK